MASDMIRMSGLNSGLDTESLVSALVSAKKTKVDEAKQAKTKLEWTQTAWKDMNSKIYGLYTGSLSTMRYQSAYSKKVMKSTNSALTAIAGENASNGIQTAQVKALAKAGYLTGAAIKTTAGEKVTGNTKLSDLGMETGGVIKLQVAGETSEITIEDGMTMNDLVKKFQEAGVNANFDENNQRLFISAKETGVANDFLFTGGGALLDRIGITASAGATRIKGSDAELILNGASFKSSTNNFEINGSTYTVNSVTDAEFTISTETDTSGIYDMIKDFFKSYNETINGMAAAYNADSAKGYEPLTDEMREQLSDKQAEDWEKKIKDSLLRKDSTLSSVMQAMRNAMNSGIEIDGKTYYLSDFGINTQGYLMADENERYAYHIDGNADDSVSAGNADKLKAMITTDPELVTKFFSELTKGLYDTLTEKMGSSEYSSVYKVYNDKKMKSDYDNYTKKIAELEAKLQDYEDRYYKKFTAMEKAMATLNSQQSAISSLFGM